MRRNLFFSWLKGILYDWRLLLNTNHRLCYFSKIKVKRVEWASSWSFCLFLKISALNVIDFLHERRDRENSKILYICFFPNSCWSKTRFKRATMGCKITLSSFSENLFIRFLFFAGRYISRLLKSPWFCVICFLFCFF